MQSNNDNQLAWLHQRGITPEVLSLFNITTQYEHPTIGPAIRIPFSQHHAKYRRDPADERKPKYLYDTGGKVTLYGLDKLVDNQSTEYGPTPLFKQTVIVTEGELDTLVCWSHNLPAVSSTAGAMSWQEEWSELLAGYDVYLCFDNDETGAKGMVKALKSLPTASVVLLPDMVDGKDISDYVARGGDLRALLDTALRDINPELIASDMGKRKGMMLHTRFHQAYLDDRQQALHRDSYSPSNYTGDDKVLRAKSYPMTELLAFTRRKMCCPWHQESTPSLQYYPKTNSAYCFGQCGRAYDVIDAYRQVHNVGFVEAVKELNKIV